MTANLIQTPSKIEFGIKYDLPVGLTLNAAYFEVQANKPVLNGDGTSSEQESETTGFELQLTELYQKNGMYSLDTLA